jgi:hypothetical protein
MLDLAPLPIRSANHLSGQQTFASETERARLTPAALAGFLKLAEAWNLTVDEAAVLLGVSASTFDRIRAGAWRGALGQDQLMRVSALIGSFKGLNLLFADGMADRWPRLRNKGPLFDNATPVERMIEGGIPAMIEIRRHIDALRGGL